MEADKNLLMIAMAFQVSFKEVGIELEVNTESLDKLEKIMNACDKSTLEDTAQGVAVFLGCIIRENIGGKWSCTKEGGYKIIKIGNKLISIDVIEDLLNPLLESDRPTIKDLYLKIEDKITG